MRYQLASVHTQGFAFGGVFNLFCLLNPTRCWINVILMVQTLRLPQQPFLSFHQENCLIPQVTQNHFSTVNQKTKK